MPSDTPQAQPSEASEIDPRVVVIGGPTAAGKTGAAIELAERIGGEVISADSVQVYRHMDIGTAKPSLEERRGIPHHGIDLVNPDEAYHAAAFARDAGLAVRRIRARGRTPLLVGGTGLYLRAFLEGLSGGVPADPELRRQLETRADEAAATGDASFLHRELRALDPERAEALHPNDRVRLIRAIEIARGTGGPVAGAPNAEPECAWQAVYCVIDPGDGLRDAIDRRCDAMLEGGLLQEVRELRERGYGPELRSMQALGYRHMQPVIEGREILGHVAERMKADTWQYARRQRTWFRGVGGATWCGPKRIPIRSKFFSASSTSVA